MGEVFACEQRVLTSTHTLVCFMEMSPNIAFWSSYASLLNAVVGIYFPACNTNVKIIAVLLCITINFILEIFL